MASTATVSPTMKQEIMDGLSMLVSDTILIEKIPNKVNIRYEVRSAPKDIAKMFSPVIADIILCNSSQKDHVH